MQLLLQTYVVYAGAAGMQCTYTSEGSLVRWKSSSVEGHSGRHMIHIVDGYHPLSGYPAEVVVLAWEE